MRAFFVRYLPRVLGAALAATALASPAVSLAQTHDEQIHGKIQSIEGTYNLSIAGDDGYVDSVAMQQDTTISPPGLALAPGMEVTVTGYSSGSVFTAVAIDTPYTYSGPAPVAAYYGPGAWYPGYPFGYGPSFSIGISFGGSGGYSAYREPWTGSWIANSAPSTYQNGTVTGGYVPDSGGVAPPAAPNATVVAPPNVPSLAPAPFVQTAGAPAGAPAANVSGAPVSLYVPGGSPVNVYIQGASPAGAYAAAGTTAPASAPATVPALDDMGNDVPPGVQGYISRQPSNSPVASPNGSATYAGYAPGRAAVLTAYGQAPGQYRAAPVVLPSYAYLPGTYHATPAALPPYAISPSRYSVAPQAPGYRITTAAGGSYSSPEGYQH
jgi:hypothetical protein